MSNSTIFHIGELMTIIASMFILGNIITTSNNKMAKVFSDIVVAVADLKAAIIASGSVKDAQIAEKDAKIAEQAAQIEALQANVASGGTDEERDALVADIQATTASLTPPAPEIPVV